MLAGEAKADMPPTSDTVLLFYMYLYVKQQAHSSYETLTSPNATLPFTQSSLTLASPPSPHCTSPPSPSTPPVSPGEADDLVAWYRELTGGLCLFGRVLVSHQGVNGTVSGGAAATAQFEAAVEAFALGGPGGRQLFRGVHWKRSGCGADGEPPFPDLRVRLVKEIVSSGGTIDVDVTAGGEHLSPGEWHAALARAEADDNLVVLDVRNRWEHEVGHFTDAAGRAAIHPNMRNFTQFREYVDAEGPELFGGKKVLMYCTGGIRCETASAYLRSTGLCAEVCQLQGGIHNYVESFNDKVAGEVVVGEAVVEAAVGEAAVVEAAVVEAAVVEAAGEAAAGGAVADVGLAGGDEAIEEGSAHAVGEEGKGEALFDRDDKEDEQKGYFLGKNFVFDRRVAMAGSRSEGKDGAVVGRCSECATTFDELCGDRVCTVCVCPVLVCEECRQGVAVEVPSDVPEAPLITMLRYEWYCQEHAPLRNMFHHFLDVFSVAALRQQKACIVAALDNKTRVAQITKKLLRRQLARQIGKLDERVRAIVNAGAPVRDPHGPRRCRNCAKESCSGRCWGFWKPPPAASAAAAAPPPAAAAAAAAATDAGLEGTGGPRSAAATAVHTE